MFARLLPVLAGAALLVPTAPARADADHVVTGRCTFVGVTLLSGAIEYVVVGEAVATGNVVAAAAGVRCVMTVANVSYPAGSGAGPGPVVVTTGTVVAPVAPVQICAYPEAYWTDRHFEAGPATCTTGTI